MKLNATVRGRSAKVRAEMAHQAVEDGVLPLKLVRPGLLPGDDPARVVGEIVDECGAAAIGGVGIDLLHQFLVGLCAHGIAPLIGCCQSWRPRTHSSNRYEI